MVCGKAFLCKVHMRGGVVKPRCCVSEFTAANQWAARLAEEIFRP